MVEQILVNKELFVELVTRLAVYQKASHVMSESRWNDLDWESMHDKAKPVLEQALQALGRVSKIGAIGRKIKSWFTTNYSPEMRSDAARLIKQAEVEVYNKGRNEPEYKECGQNQTLSFKRFSGESDYADFSWKHFKKPREAIDLLNHVLTKQPQMDEVVKLVNFICRHAKANHSPE